MMTPNEEKHLEEVEAALIDMTDGMAWWDIQAKTGVSEERAREIEDIAQRASKSYNERRGI